MGQKKLTLEDLAGMVGHGFSAADEHFEEIHEALEEVFRRFNSLDYLLSQDYGRRIQRLEERVQKLEGQPPIG